MRQRAMVADRATSTRFESHAKAPALPLILLCAGILLFPTPLREMLFGEVARAINFVAWFGLIFALMGAKPPINILRFKVGPVLVALLMAALLAVATPASRQEFIPLDLVVYVAPVLIVGYSGEQSLADTARQLLPIWHWFLNLGVVVITASGIVDLVFNNAASRFFTELYGARSLMGLLSEGRMVSFYGHALVAASIIMTAFCVSYLLSIVRNRRIPAHLLILYVAAMGLTTSKSGFVLLLLAIAFTSFRAGRWRNILITAIGLGAAYFYGLLDVVLFRLSEGYESGDITTGRNDALEALFGAGGMSFFLLTGQVMDTTDTTLIAALEYPPLRFAFRYGIVFALIFTLAFFVRPLFKMLKPGHRRPLVAWLALAISVNTYSGIAAYGDILLLFSITTALALVVSQDSSANVGEPR